jgi:hypothetical protein
MIFVLFSPWQDDIYLTNNSKTIRGLLVNVRAIADVKQATDAASRSP